MADFEKNNSGAYLVTCETPINDVFCKYSIYLNLPSLSGCDPPLREVAKKKKKLSDLTSISVKSLALKPMRREHKNLFT